MNDKYQILSPLLNGTVPGLVMAGASGLDYRQDFFQGAYLLHPHSGGPGRGRTVRDRAGDLHGAPLSLGRR